MPYEGGIADAAYNGVSARASWKAGDKVDKYEYSIRFYQNKKGHPSKGRKITGNKKWSKNKKYTKTTREIRIYKYNTVGFELKVRSWKGKKHSDWVTKTKVYK